MENKTHAKTKTERRVGCGLQKVYSGTPGVPTEKCPKRLKKFSLQKMLIVMCMGISSCIGVRTISRYDLASINGRAVGAGGRGRGPAGAAPGACFLRPVDDRRAPPKIIAPYVTAHTTRHGPVGRRLRRSAYIYDALIASFTFRPLSPSYRLVCRRPYAHRAHVQGRSPYLEKLSCNKKQTRRYNGTARGMFPSVNIDNDGHLTDE
ncbi:hypothetical protein EVAR_49634_1 [Eumeta japonica]|uniref:Uncharacterized protein n=1 Tax=Eumeta variegata TaxID=151549 RepID=A0A4C1YAL3_EUMVA|nr:hypothetical protein EVAR_49634_1 [Eumeta japonica]